jgi:hypothetical protein
MNLGNERRDEMILPEITPRRDVISSAISCSARAGPCTSTTSMVLLFMRWMCRELITSSM